MCNLSQGVKAEGINIGEISTFCLRPHHKYNYPNWLTIIKLLLLDLFVKTLVSNSNRIIGSHIFGAIVTLCVAFRTEQNRL